MQPKVHFTAAAIAIAIVCLICHNGYPARSQDPTLAMHGRYSLAGVLHKSEPLCYALSSNSTIINVTGTLEPSAAWDGLSNEKWLVDAQDEQGNHKMHLVWDAGTGDLVSVSHSPEGAAPTHRQVLLTRDARCIASSWLATLGIVCESSKYRIDGQPMCKYDRWFVKWRTDDHKYLTVVDSRSGDLIMAQRLPLDHGGGGLTR